LCVAIAPRADFHKRPYDYTRRDHRFAFWRAGVAGFGAKINCENENFFILACFGVAELVNL
jgi:hypothetical protein